MQSCTKFSNLLVFNSLLQILKFSDPYDFLAWLFASPLPKEGILALRFWGHWIIWGPALFGSRAVWIPR